MSLETLLEAAKYLEYRSEAKARGEEPHDYHTFARLSASGDGLLYKSSKLPSSNNNNNKVSGVLDRSDTFNFTSDDSKDKSRRGGGAGTREVHNKLEKNRRAHLKECFETLKKQLPNMDERKTSNLSILRGALRYIQTLKRKEREYEHEMERLAREKIAAQQRLASLKKDLPLQLEHIDVNNLLPDVDNETTTTASECGPLSDLEEEDEEDGEDEAPRNVSSLSKSPSSTGEGSPSSSNSAISMSTVRSSSTVSNVDPSSGPTFTTSKSVISNINQTVSTFLQSFEIPGNSSASTWPNNKVTSTISNVDSVPLVKMESPKSQPQNLEMKNSGLAEHVQLSQINHNGNEKSGISEAPAETKAQLLIRPNSAKMLQVSPPVLPSSPPKPTNPLMNSGGPVSVESSIISSVVTMTMPSSAESVMPKTTVSPQPIRLATSTAPSSAKLMTPMTLVAPQAVVNVTQVAAAANKPIIINQAAGMTRVTMVANPSSQLTLTPVNMKPGNALTTFTNLAPLSTVTPTTNHQIVHHSTANVLSSSAETQTTPSNPSSSNSKSLSQILHSTVSQRSFSGQQVLSSPVSSIANVGRHLVTTTLKPAGNASHLRSTLPQLAGVAHVAHVMSQAPVAAASVGQIVSAGTHMSPVTPIVAPLSVVSHSTSPMIPQRQQLGKVLTSPILKSVGQINQIPIIQRQFLQPTIGSVSAHAQPVVVVSMPNMVSSSNVVQQHSGQHTSALSVPVSQ